MKVYEVYYSTTYVDGIVSTIIARTASEATRTVEFWNPDAVIEEVMQMTPKGLIPA